MVTVTIDGRTIQVPKGTNLVEAAKLAGIEIPVFCYHPKLDPAGVCRMCLVQIEKIPKPQAACVTNVDRDGMVVMTQTPAVDDLRKGVLEFLLLNHPLDCPVCDKGGECDLQDLTIEHGPAVSRLVDPKIHKPKSVELGNFIVLDNERCILCRRCVRFDDEIATEGNLIIEERGHSNFVTMMAGESYDSYFSGNTIELCPVGALTSEQYRFQARPWDLKKVESVCHGCSVGCNVNEEFRFGKLLRLTARDNAAIDNGWMCDRGRFNYKFVHEADRVTQPLVKKDGQFVPVTWAEALATVAEKFKAIKASVGGKGFGVIGGGKLANEEAYLLQKFARVALQTNNVDHRVSEQLVASLAAFPGKQTDISDAGAILIVDTEPAETAPVLDLRIRRMADRKKAKLAVVGAVMPAYRGRHARVQVKPGQTAGVLAALAAVAAGRQPAASAADPVAVTKLVELLKGAKKVVILWGGNDAATGKALIDLASALKKAAMQNDPGRSVHVLIPGAQANSRGAEAMGVLPNFFPGYAPAAEAKTRETVSNLWGVRNLVPEPGLATGAMLKAAADGEVKALVLSGANLLNTYPDRKLVTEALDKAFVVAFDIFLNETAAAADVVLPVAAISEKSGTYTTLDGLVQAVKIAKKPEGSAQADGDILVALASAMGVRLAESPLATNNEIGKLVAKLDGSVTLTGAPNSLLPAAAPASAVAPATAVAGDLLLVPVDRLYAGGSTAQFDVEFRHAQPKPEATFNPADAARLGLKAGEEIELAAGDGFIRLSVAVDKRVVAGTVQAIRGLSAAPVNALMNAVSGTAPVAVTARKLALEVAD
jgi:NADH-quinone oxidoreductase chain G